MELDAQTAELNALMTVCAGSLLLSTYISD